jgi:hypothetical protein
MEFHLMDVSMDQPQQHWLGEQEGQGFYVEFSHFLSMTQGNLSTGIDKKTIRLNLNLCFLTFYLPSTGYLFSEDKVPGHIFI